MWYLRKSCIFTNILSILILWRNNWEIQINSMRFVQSTANFMIWTLYYRTKDLHSENEWVTHFNRWIHISILSKPRSFSSFCLSADEQGNKWSKTTYFRIRKRKHKLELFVYFSLRDRPKLKKCCFLRQTRNGVDHHCCYTTFWVANGIYLLVDERFHLFHSFYNQNSRTNSVKYLNKIHKTGNYIRIKIYFGIY